MFKQAALICLILLSVTVVCKIPDTPKIEGLDLGDIPNRELTEEEYKKYFGDNYTPEMHMDPTKIAQEMRSDGGDNSVHPDLGHPGFPGAQGPPNQSMNINAADVEQMKDSIFNRPGGVPGDGVTDPNDELRGKFLELFEEYASRAGTPEERERRSKIMTSEKDWMKQVPSEFTKMHHNSLGTRAPGDGQEEPHEAPLEDHQLTHGHDEARIPKNHRGDPLVPKNRNDIKFIKGNVHISKHILQKLVKQNAYMKEIGMEAHPTNFSESHFPGMHEMGGEEKEWFMEYQKRHKKAKENMETGDYHILEEIGLLDDIPGALCVIASLKPGVHEEGQAILSHYFHVPLTGGHKPKDVKANNGLKRSYEVVEKVVLDAIDKCRTKLGKSVEKNGFIEVIFPN
jgi:hypothetical protein